MNKQTSVNIAVSGGATLCWIGLIFYFSAQPGAVSSGQSGQTIYKLASLFWPGFTGWGPNKQSALVDSMQVVVRKSAHFMVYAVLGALLFWAVSAWQKKGGKRLGLTWACGFLYAAFDEAHQYFVPGRSAQFGDVLLDTTGIIAGSLLCLAAVFLLKKRKHRSKAKQAGEKRPYM